MRWITRHLACFVLCGTAVAHGQQAGFSGTYRLQGADGTLTVTLQQTGERVTGTMSDDGGNTMRVDGEVDEDGLSGLAYFGQQAIEFWAELSGDRLTWTLEVEEGAESEYVLTRVRDATAQNPLGRRSAAPAGGRANPLAPASPYVGRFAKADGTLALTIAGQGEAFTGTLTIGAAAGTASEFPVTLHAEGDGLAGTFGSGRDVYPIAVRLDPKSDGGRLVVTSEGSVHELDRAAAASPAQGRTFRQSAGWFTLSLPDGWGAVAEDPTTVILDPRRPGAIVLVLCGQLDPDEIGRPLPGVFQGSLGGVDEILAGIGIRADSRGARVTTLDPSHHPAAEARWDGASDAQAVKIWSGAASGREFFVLMLAVLDPAEAAGIVADARQVLASIEILHEPSAAEVERAAASVSGGGPAEDPLAPAQGQPQQFTRRVTINGTRLDDATLALLEQGMGIQIPDYDYWYDPMCGAVGGMGGPAVGFFPPGLNLGGPLPADASGGGNGMITGVFVNGRELHPMDYAGLSSITGPVPPGRYWLDGQGNYGVEGGGRAGNLLLLARAQQMQGGGGAGGGGGSQAWTRYKDYGGVGGQTNFGSFGNGDFYFSGGGVDWWPGK